MLYEVTILPCRGYYSFSWETSDDVLMLNSYVRCCWIVWTSAERHVGHSKITQAEWHLHAGQRCPLPAPCLWWDSAGCKWNIYGKLLCIMWHHLQEAWPKLRASVVPAADEVQPWPSDNQVRPMINEHLLNDKFTQVKQVSSRQLQTPYLLSSNIDVAANIMLMAKFMFKM